MLKYKIDVLETLKESGYNTTRLRKEQIVGESAIQSLRKGEMIGIKTLEKICDILDMQPGNIIKYVEDTEK
ncbi:MAG: XRE family transcriptional regulator [Clostridiales bacterium 41_12_two_minus]|jgi:DNA-binding Xre family transcriptional regulator|nr:MAG: XRE family transcriptional regulator [Clostridiales bacterium 41_12_two_minus]